ncbi:aminotransferase class III-fold pyridoxal phosphate-dependent enzyme [Gordonia jinghuaiqii]|uniref:Aspartate aminotransferase family protein n=1 Tax=Gordonia jinghuaiqii TaxID=2758710 RepID=A0A7D7QHF7_9ACTN|nr:aspartate aminotransferase family protein [Gordonia jinghuaiqii]MCR5978343.1 aminotransferase class III-fold pyridoxal phosphate-dependent enzyme [Gordonia jinghuaiqii]QMT01224.1 aspartate aminotransferase family protein [Gordonia jinghuaiqii]
MSEPHIMTLQERRARALGPAYRLFYREPVHVVRGSGTRLFDIDGVEYLDAYNNVPAVGHCHPRVVEAQYRQAATLNTHTRYLGTDLVDYAERLLATFPAPLANVMFTCTGSEAIDLALRVARHRRPGTGVVVTENAYHGTTAAAAAISPSLGGFAPLGTDVRVVPAPHRFPADEVDTAFPAAVRAAIDDLGRHGHGVAAFVADSIFASDGVIPGPTGFLRGAAEAVRAAGGVYIADEVQPGFGRLGTGMWGFARHGVEPDMVVLGKPMGNGMPIAATVVRPELLAAFGSEIRYFNTFGGNPVAIAAADAVLDVIDDENLIANAERVGAHLRTELRRLTADCPFIGEVRGAGLFLGLDVLDEHGRPDAAATDLVINTFRDERVLVGSAGLGSTAVKVRPPLPFSMDDADRLLEVTERVLTVLVRDQGKDAAR